MQPESLAQVVSVCAPRDSARTIVGPKSQRSAHVELDLVRRVRLRRGLQPFFQRRSLQRFSSLGYPSWSRILVGRMKGAYSPYPKAPIPLQHSFLQGFSGLAPKGGRNRKIQLEREHPAAGEELSA